MKDDDDWVFDTVKAPTMVIREDSDNSDSGSIIHDPLYDESSEMMENIRISSPPPQPKYANNTAVRRVPAPDRNPSLRRPKRQSSGVKQPLGVDLTFGNSPSTVRQFRRVSDKAPAEDSFSSYQLAGDENSSPKSIYSESNSKEAQLGRRAYSKAVGHACQEVLGTTADQEKREAISRLAEAWSDLEMADPEGLYHILRATNERLSR